MVMIAEIVTFRALAGADPAAMGAAAAGIAVWLGSCPGFVARTLSGAEDGIWTDHVVWNSLAEALAAAERIMQEPAAAPFMALIDPACVTISHAPVATRQTV